MCSTSSSGIEGPAHRSRLCRIQTSLQHSCYPFAAEPEICCVPLDELSEFVITASGTCWFALTSVCICVHAGGPQSLPWDKLCRSSVPLITFLTSAHRRSVGLLLPRVPCPSDTPFLTWLCRIPSACFADGLWDYYSPESSVLSDTRRQMRRLEEDPQAVRSFVRSFLFWVQGTVHACGGWRRTRRRCHCARFARLQAHTFLASVPAAIDGWVCHACWQALLCSTAELMGNTVLLTHVQSRGVSAGGGVAAGAGTCAPAAHAAFRHTRRQHYDHGCEWLFAGIYDCRHRLLCELHRVSLRLLLARKHC